MKNTLNKIRKAFSLIEVIFAISIISFGMVSLIGLLTVGLKTSSMTKEEFIATNLLSLVVADYQNTPSRYYSSPGNANASKLNTTAIYEFPSPFSASMSKGNKVIRYWGMESGSKEKNWLKVKPFPSFYTLKIQSLDQESANSPAEWRRLFFEISWPVKSGKPESPVTFQKVQAFVICMREVNL